MLTGAAEEFLRDTDHILTYKRTKPLVECGNFTSELTGSLKEFARTHAYNSPSVLEIELQGAQVIVGLMDLMWKAITNRGSFSELGSRRPLPQDAYVYSKMSSSYRWHFERESAGTDLPIRYREAQLLTDMISGMTDRFAVDLYAELRAATNG